MNDLLTATELAGHLKLQPSTIKNWARRGRIPEVWLSPRVRRFRLGPVLRALEKKRKK